MPRVVYVRVECDIIEALFEFSDVDCLDSLETIVSGQRRNPFEVILEIQI